MRDLTRRQVLQGMLAASAISGLPPHGRAAAGPQPSPSPKGLNLILHGSFAFVIWKQFIELLPPKVAHHRYQAGSKTKKVELSPKRSYQLLGVTNPSAQTSLDKDLDVVVPGVVVVDRHPDLVYCSIFVPHPNSFFPKRGMKKKGHDFLSDKPNNVHEPGKRLASVHVLAYDSCTPAEVGLNGPLPYDTSGSHLNFHIWAEPEMEMTAGDAVRHNRELSGALQDIFPRSDVEFSDFYHHMMNQDPANAGEDSLPPDIVDSDLDADLIPVPAEKRVYRPPARPPAICQSIIADNQT